MRAYFFIGYLISIALFGLYQAIFMANAGGAWDNAKKIVETELKAGRGHPTARGHRRRRHRRRPLQGHVLGRDEPGHQVHDALRPAGRRARGAARQANAAGFTIARASAIFFAISAFFVYRSFYGMRIGGSEESHAHAPSPAPAE
jgi:K(+)-stimulated pyrophosphate-energized sodium pump